MAGACDLLRRSNLDLVVDLYNLSDDRLKVMQCKANGWKTLGRMLGEVEPGDDWSDAWKEYHHRCQNIRFAFLKEKIAPVPFLLESVHEYKQAEVADSVSSWRWVLWGCVAGLAISLVGVAVMVAISGLLFLVHFPFLAPVWDLTVRLAALCGLLSLGIWLLKDCELIVPEWNTAPFFEWSEGRVIPEAITESVRNIQKRFYEAEFEVEYLDFFDGNRSRKPMLWMRLWDGTRYPLYSISSSETA